MRVSPSFEPGYYVRNLVLTLLAPYIIVEHFSAEPVLHGLASDEGVQWVVYEIRDLLGKLDSIQ